MNNTHRKGGGGSRPRVPQLAPHLGVSHLLQRQVYCGISHLLEKSGPKDQR